MNTIKAILVDDEARGLSSLKRLLEYNCPEVIILDACTNADEAIVAIENKKPDLIFLDIEMPGKNGFEMLGELEHVDFETIFVTAYHEFTEQALHLSAVDYLLKPVDETMLISAVQLEGKRVGLKKEKEPVDTFVHNMQARGNPKKMKLCIPSLKGFQVVKLRNIMYIEASGNYSNFLFTNRSMICASKALHEYETLLADCDFVRVHKSFMVNLNHITEYVRGEGGYLILTDGKEIEVSRRKKEELMERMKDYFKY
jgi:two-component system LytT family response regulator